MFCMKCGAEMEDGTMFCQNCGAPVERETVTSNPVVTAQTDFVPQMPEAPVFAPPKPPMSRKKRNLIIAAAAAAALMIAVVLIIVLQPAKFNLNDYVEVSFSGHDGYGEAYVSLKSDKLAEDILDKQGEKSKGEISSWDDVLEYANSGTYDIIECVYSIDVKVDPEQDLSNGDTVTVTFKYDEELAKEQKIKFSAEKMTFTVEGLEPVEEIDPFADLNVSFSGISPNGRVEYTYNGDNDYISTYDFEADKESGLQNGDIVTIRIEEDEYNASYYGYTCTKTEMQYTVSGLSEYVSSFDELTEDFVAELKQEAEDSIYSYTAGNYSDESSMADLAYVGYALLTQKPDADVYYGNMLYIVYRGLLSSSENSFAPVWVYYPVLFTNVLLEDGKLSYEELDGIEGYSYLENAWYSTAGYVNPLTAYAELVTEDTDRYIAACGDGFEKFSDYTPIASLKDITEQCKKDLQKTATDYLETHIADYNDDYEGDSAITGLTYVGDYLLIAKNQGSDYPENNRYLLVYSATVTMSDEGETKTVYFPFLYRGVMNLNNGEYLVSAQDEIQGKSNYPGRYSNNAGYLDGNKMFANEVTAYRDKYTYEVSDGLTQFGE